MLRNDKHSEIMLQAHTSVHICERCGTSLRRSFDFDTLKWIPVRPEAYYNKNTACKSCQRFLTEWELRRSGRRERTKEAVTSNTPGTVIEGING